MLGRIKEFRKVSIHAEILKHEQVHNNGVDIFETCEYSLGALCIRR